MCAGAKWLDLTCLTLMQAASAFAAQLDATHDNACPWRGNKCDNELISFPALSAPAMLRVWQGHLQSLSGLSCLPPLGRTDAQALISANRYSWPQDGRRVHLLHFPAS